MAINKNHEFEDLNGVKCAIVEKGATQDRVDFLKPLLEHNKFTVIVADSPPPKAAAKPAAAQTAEGEPTEASPIVVEDNTLKTFTIGVTDVSFNPTNAIFGRMLKTPDKRIVSLAYWQQKEKISNDETPYFENTAK